MKLKEPKYRHHSVMLIDDNELDNFINEKTMEGDFYASKIYVNTSSKSALEFLQNLVIMANGNDVLFPEVIFVDLNMPLMDGFQFIDAYKKTIEGKIGTPKLVILTSSVYEEDRLKAEKAGKNVIFLNKPLTKDMLAKI
jgi:CheY-like chemotaxis protein